MDMVSASNFVITTMNHIGFSGPTIKQYKAHYDGLQAIGALHPEWTFQQITENYKEQHAYLLPTSITFKNLNKALSVLSDVMKNETVPSSFGKTISLSKQLPATFINVLDEYISSSVDIYSQKHLATVRERCGRFLVSLFRNGITRIEDISYEFLSSFYENNNYSISMGAGMYASTIQSFLFFLSKAGYIPFAYSLFLDQNRKSTLLTELEFSPKDWKTIQSYAQESIADFPPNEFLESMNDFHDVLKSHNYERTVCSVWHCFSESLYLFLHRNQLGYHPEIVKIWLKYYSKLVSISNYKMSRRLARLFEVYVQNGDILPERVFFYGETKTDKLPAWCQTIVLDFLETKKREHKQISTVTLYRSSVTRFCEWMVSKNINSFSDLTGEMVMQFNLEDPHSTTEGKSAYNSRIRKFLMYIEEKGYTSNVKLHDALSSTCCIKERPVNILTDQEINNIHEYVTNADNELDLRNAAILELGLEMGIRATDVANLKWQSIDWKNRSIHFIQKKTLVEVNLPMPVSVGNAIYRYLQVRPLSKSEFVFLPISSRSQHICRYCCSAALYRVLPERKGKGRGYHILRKTYATGLLKNGVGKKVIVTSLGQTTEDSLSHYLSLDEERMFMCGLSLKSEEIPLKEDNYA